MRMAGSTDSPGDPAASPPGRACRELLDFIRNSKIFGVTDLRALAIATRRVATFVDGCA